MLRKLGRVVIRLSPCSIDSTLLPSRVKKKKSGFKTIPFQNNAACFYLPKHRHTAGPARAGGGAVRSELEHLTPCCITPRSGHPFYFVKRSRSVLVLSHSKSVITCASLFGSRHFKSLHARSKGALPVSCQQSASQPRQLRGSCRVEERACGTNDRHLFRITTFAWFCP